ncbi:MAG: cytochrome c biogenesis protein ResB [Deltaproteobacteria bacterium]|nr:cytochrome c biogenesis protein ResB [Deltaproteobacteria bacterium]
MSRKQESGTPGRLVSFFASVKLSITLLFVLAATSILGTVIPQNEPARFYQENFSEPVLKIFTAFNLTDMYHSLWFTALLLLLGVNLVVCSLRRLPKTWKVARSKGAGFSDSRFAGIRHKEEFSSKLPADQLAAAAEKILSKKFRRVKTAQTRSGTGLWAERGRWSRLGPYVIHLGFLLTLVGGLVGSLWGFSGFMNLPEGDTMDHAFLRKTGQAVHLPFAIRCEDFDVSFYENGMPKEYTSRLTVLEDGKEAFTTDIEVNHPLRYQGINVFQSSYGNYLSATLTFLNPQTGKTWDKTVRIREMAELPEGAGRFMVVDFSEAFKHQGKTMGPVFHLHVFPKNGRPTRIHLIAGVPRDKAPAAGPFKVLAKDWQQRYYTGLQITRDPGVGLVYTGFALIILGCFITFFLYHGQVFVKVSGNKALTKVAVAGLANRNQQGFELKVRSLAEELAEAAGKLEKHRKTGR